MVISCIKLITYSIATSDEQDLDMKTSLTQMTNFPSGSSAKTFKHYAQLLDGKFTKYSYDSKTNMKLYGSKTAPEYNLKNVKVRLYIYQGNLLVQEELNFLRILGINSPNMAE